MADANPRFVVPPVGTCTLAQPGATITEPKGSDESSTNLRSSWKRSPCFHFDFQAVVKGCPGWYALTIKGRVDRPSTFSPKWSLDAKAGTLSGDNRSRPGHATPTSPGEGSLKLMAMKGTAATGCGDERRIKIFADHLARDRENFGTGTPCGNSVKGPWALTRRGVSIPMRRGWNCFGSVDHAYNGSGPGYAENLNIPMSWKQTHYHAPISAKDWAAISASLSRGDVVSFWSGLPEKYVPQHAHTCISGNTMYGANNEPVGYASWTWFETTSEAYFKATNSSPGLEGFLTLVIVHKKPTSK